MYGHRVSSAAQTASLLHSTAKYLKIQSIHDKKHCVCIINTNQLTLFSENVRCLYTHRVCTLQFLEAEVCGADERTSTFCETRSGLLSVEHHCSHSNCLTFGTGVLHLIQINHQPDATIFQFIILTFVYSSTCFGRFPARYQELNDCSGSLWFYLRIVVTVVLCSWSGRPLTLGNIGFVCI